MKMSSYAHLCMKSKTVHFVMHYMAGVHPVLNTSMVAKIRYVMYALSLSLDVCPLGVAIMSLLVNWMAGVFVSQIAPHSGICHVRL